MKGKFWKGILVLAMAVVLLGVFFQTGCNQKTTPEEQKRWELLKQNSWLRISQGIMIGNNRAYIVFMAESEKVEYVYVGLDDQSYFIDGKGHKVIEVRWDGRATSKITISVSDRKANLDLPQEVIERIIENGTRYYFMVRKHFGVDTYDGLKQVIESEKEKFNQIAK